MTPLRSMRDREPNGLLAASASTALELLVAMLLTVVLGSMLVTACTGCAALKPAPRTIDDAATILCSTAFGVQERAKAVGLSIEEWCAVKKNFQPFLDEALRARAAGAGAAGLPAPPAEK